MKMLYIYYNCMFGQIIDLLHIILSVEPTNMSKDLFLCKNSKQQFYHLML